MKSPLEILNMLDSVIDEIRKEDYSLFEKVDGNDVIDILMMVRKWIVG